ncbi:MAG TPA: dihydropteroate synthase [Candidatus Binatia bacterium]|nr:dihydropteroate synthase [Candidatus Binatia bacterium]
MATAQLGELIVGDGCPVRLVGVINVSPESFYGGSVARDRSALLHLAQRMVAEGADLLDVGAMSTAPYRPTMISEAEEVERMTAAIETLRRAVRVPISVDTTRAAVAAAALAAGANVINDVTGLASDPKMAAVAAEAEGIILMAQAVEPSQQPPTQMVQRLLRACLERARATGIADERIVLDPGIGFYRHAARPWDEIDCLIIRELNQLRAFDRPLLVGISRKSFVGKLTDKDDPADRLLGSLAATAVAVYNGAALIRTHDVAAARDVVRVAERLRGA